MAARPKWCMTLQQKEKFIVHKKQPFKTNPNEY
jgi:hypothetical protein